MSPPTFLDNLRGQPDALRQVATFYGGDEGRNRLSDASQRLDGRCVTSTGMGASLFALFATRRSLDSALPGHGIEETSYLSENLDALSRPADGLLVVTQSGETVEAKTLLSLHRAQTTVVVTRDEGSTVAAAANVVLPLACEADLSVALQTYVSSLAVLQLLATRMKGGDIDATLRGVVRCATAIERLVPLLEPLIEAISEPFVTARQIYAIGRGASLGTALGTGLLLKEAARRDCEGLSSAQFRHGAVEVVSKQTAIVAFTGDRPETAKLDDNLIAELVGYGGHVLAVGAGNSNASSRRLELPDVGRALRPVVEIVAMQLLAATLARHNAVVPGEFRNSATVVTTA